MTPSRVAVSSSQWWHGVLAHVLACSRRRSSSDMQGRVPTQRGKLHLPRTRLVCSHYKGVHYLEAIALQQLGHMSAYVYMHTLSWHAYSTM